jgi:bifunctional DNA-binding transcriptional regulator/antitoxin component of YhaV-PrlF toxin-antitoxin module
MGIELKITAKGQVTLKQSLLAHLGVRPGDHVDVMELPDGRVELKAKPARPDIKSLFGALWRPGQRAVSIEEMQEAIEAGACGEDD